MAHDVTLWTSAGTSLVTANIPRGTAATLGPNNFRYVTLNSAFVLGPGTYVISAYYQQASYDLDFANPGLGTVTTASAVTYGTAADTTTNGISFFPSPFHGSRSFYGNGFPVS